MSETSNRSRRWNRHAARAAFYEEVAALEPRVFDDLLDSCVPFSADESGEAFDNALGGWGRRWGLVESWMLSDALSTVHYARYKYIGDEFDGVPTNGSSRRPSNLWKDEPRVIYPERPAMRENNSILWSSFDLTLTPPPRASEMSPVALLDDFKQQLEQIVRDAFPDVFYAQESRNENHWRWLALAAVRRRYGGRTRSIQEIANTFQVDASTVRSAIVRCCVLLDLTSPIRAVGRPKGTKDAPTVNRRVHRE